MGFLNHRINSKKSKMLSGLVLVMLVSVILGATVSSNASRNVQVNLTDEQMVLLSNYAYVDNGSQLVSIKDNLESKKTNGVYDKSKIALPCSGVTDTKAIKMFKEIENDSTLIDLVAVDSIETAIRAICFVPSKNVNVQGAEAVLVFMGTKGNTEAWLDNLEGTYYTDTELQLEAAAFFERVSQKYTITNITGHSKGGNLSQYVTITQGEKVRKCVSLDGQGFSQLFIDKYSSKIKANVGKINAYASNREPVHVLLTTVVPNMKYIKTDEDVDCLNSHSPGYLYENEFFNTNGSYSSKYFTEETALVQNTRELADYIVENVEQEDFAAVSEKVAPIIGYLFPVFSDAVANEDMPIVPAVCSEIIKRAEENPDDDITYADVKEIQQAVIDNQTVSEEIVAGEITADGSAVVW